MKNLVIIILAMFVLLGIAQIAWGQTTANDFESRLPFVEVPVGTSLTCTSTGTADYGTTRCVARETKVAPCPSGEVEIKLRQYGFVTRICAPE